MPHVLIEYGCCSRGLQFNCIRYDYVVVVCVRWFCGLVADYSGVVRAIESPSDASTLKVLRYRFYSEIQIIDIVLRMSDDSTGHESFASMPINPEFAWFAVKYTNRTKPLHTICNAIISPFESLET